MARIFRNCSILPILFAALPAAAQDRPRARNLDQLSKLTGIPRVRLEAVKAERLFMSDIYARRELIKELVEEPSEDMLPLVCVVAEGDSDWPTQLTAVKVLSCFGLLADRGEVTRRVLPLLERGTRKRGSQILRYSMDEVLRLNRWFRCDERLEPLLTSHFRGRDRIIRGLAYRGITQLEHPRLIREKVLPYTWEVWRDKKMDRDSRRNAIRTFARYEVKAALPELQKATREGPVAIVSAYALSRFLDPSSLKALRKINKSAVHRLRMGAWLARVRLNDPRCLKEILKVVKDHTEHDEIKRTFVADLGLMTQPKAKIRRLLQALFKHRNPAVRLGAAVGLAHQGDDSGADLLIETLHGEWKDDLKLRWRGLGWKRRFGFMETLLRIKDPAGDRPLLAILDVKAPREHLFKRQQDGSEKDRYEEWWRRGSRRFESMKTWYSEYRAEAVSLCGERRIQGALPKLKAVSKSEWGHFKFQALISQIELGDVKAMGLLRWYLPKYDDRFYRDVKVVMGKVTLYTNRMNWSAVFDVCDKFERVGDADLYVPLLEELLKTEETSDDPMKKGWAKRVRGRAKRGARTTGERRDAADEDPLFRPPEVAYRMRNQFARRRIVECAARLAGVEAAPQLARALRDSRATVRAAALTQIGRVSGRFELPPGSALQAERDVWPKAITWLEEQRAWPE